MCWYDKQLSLANELMRTRRAVLLTPPLQTSASPKTHLSPFLATDQKKQPVSLIIATLPKTPSCKPFVCHTCGPLPPVRHPFRHLLFALLSPFGTGTRCLTQNPSTGSAFWPKSFKMRSCTISGRKYLRMRSDKKKWGAL